MLNFGRLIGLSLRQPLNLKNSIVNCQFIRCYCVEGKENVKQEENSNLNNETVHKKETPSSIFDDNVKTNLLRNPDAVATTSRERLTQSISTNFNNFRELIKILARDDVKYDEKNAKVILLDGIMFLNQLSNGAAFYHFVDYYLLWWKHFSSNVEHFDAENLSTTIDILGSINLRSSGLLRQVATDDHMDVLITNLLKKDFLNLPPNSINCIYNGLANFSLRYTSEILNPLSTSRNVEQKTSYPGTDLIKATIEWINKYQTNDEKFYDVVLACCFIVERLSVMNYKNETKTDEDLIKLVVDLCKTMFDLNSKLKKELSDAVDLSKMFAGQMKFARAFLKLRSNSSSFVVDDEVWTIWLAGAKNLLEICSETKALSKAISLGDVFPFTDRKMPSLISGLCSLTLSVCFTYKKMDVFAEIKPVFSRLLRTCLQPSNRRSLNELVMILREIETDADAKKIMDTKIHENEISREELWKMIVKELDRFGDKYKEKVASLKKTGEGNRKDFDEKDLDRLKKRYGQRLNQRKNFDEEQEGFDDAADDDDENFQFKTSRLQKNFVKTPPSAKSFVPPNVEQIIKRKNANTATDAGDEENRRSSTVRGQYTSFGQRTSRGGARSTSVARRNDDESEFDEVDDDDDVGDEEEEEERYTNMDRRDRNRNIGGRRFGSDKFEAFSKRGEKSVGSSKRFGNDSPNRGRISSRFDADADDDDEDFDDDDRRRPTNRRSSTGGFVERRSNRSQNQLSRNRSRNDDDFGDDDDNDYEGDSSSIRSRRSSRPSRFKDEEDAQFDRRGSPSGLLKKRAVNFDDTPSNEFRRSPSKFRSRGGSSSSRKKFDADDSF